MYGHLLTMVIMKTDFSACLFSKHAISSHEGLMTNDVNPVKSSSFYASVGGAPEANSSCSVCVCESLSFLLVSS